jgi:O-antigen ligase
VESLPQIHGAGMITAVIATTILFVCVFGYVASDSKRTLLAWAATLGFQLEIGQFHVGFADLFAAPLGAWAILLMFRRPPRVSGISIALLAFTGIFITWGNLVALLNRGYVTKWAYLNKDFGLLEMLLCMAGILAIIQSRQQLQELCNAFTYGGSALNLVGLLLAPISIITGFGKFVLYDGLRYTGFMADPNAWGAFISVVAVFQLCFLLFDKRPRRAIARNIQWGNMALLVMGVFVSMSRGAMAAMSIGMACTLIFMAPRKRLAVGTGMIIIGALLSVPLWTSGVIGAVIERISDPAGVSDRLAINREGWRMYTSSPVSVVSGVGIGTFLDSAPKLGLANQIHNTFLWLLVEGGPALLLTFLAIFGMAMRQAVRAAKAPKVSVHAIAIFCSLASCLVMFNTVEGLYQRQFWLLLALPDIFDGIRQRFRVFGFSAHLLPQCAEGLSSK